MDLQYLRETVNEASAVYILHQPRGEGIEGICEDIEKYTNDGDLCKLAKYMHTVQCIHRLI